MRTSQLTSIAAAVLLSASGCTIMDSSLLERDDGGPADARVDAVVTDAPVDAAIDAEVDAYQPFIGNLVSNADFEVDAVGWGNNGSSTVMRSTAQAHGGTASLFTTDRNSSWMGPAVTLTANVRRGKRYTATAYVRLADPGPEPVNVSVRHTCLESGQGFNEGASRTAATAIDTDWVQPSTTFTVNDSVSCTLVEFVVYVETGAGSQSFYIDDVDVQELP